jgi:transcriptional regulator with XRE-family HTH domain
VTAEDTLRAQTRATLKASGISQAEACRRLGISTKYMSQMLTGRAPLTLPWAERIVALCGRRIVTAVKRQPKKPTP